MTKVTPIKFTIWKTASLLAWEHSIHTNWLIMEHLVLVTMQKLGLVWMIKDMIARITLGLLDPCFPALGAPRSVQPEIHQHHVQTWRKGKTWAIRSFILCSRSSILDPMSSILEIIWSDMVWNLRHRMMSRKFLLVPTCLASAGACSGCSWSARPHSLDPAGQPLPCSPPLFHPYPLPHCLTLSLNGLWLWN